jgi:hypothetical protein
LTVLKDVIQDVAALKLLQKYNKDFIQRQLIQTILHASWIDYLQTRRLWLEMWSEETLRKMLSQIYHYPLT